MSRRTEHKDYTGYHFNLLTVEYLDCEKPRRKWMCRCECGNHISVYEGNIDRQQSCGCAKSKAAIERNKKATKHGETNTRLFRIWGGMRRRCYEVQNKDYPNYGGRGITVCDEWKEYIPFSLWAKNNGYSDDLSIDRIDVNGSYSPDNCRWISCVEQNNNRRSNHIVEYKGITHTISEWSRIYNIPPKTLRYRLVNGWDVESAMNVPVTKSNCSNENYNKNRLAKVF